jgi:DNA-binding LacI/PurR family transcriptional regulator
VSEPTPDHVAADGRLRRAPGMHDVGRLAGVSHQTVSRVLNDHPSVREETRQRVLDAIAQLGYRRNTAARALVTHKSATIGVVTAASPLFGPSSTLLSVEWAARDAGYFVSVASVRMQDRAGLDRSLDHFLGQSVEGVVVIAPQDFAAEAVAAAAGQIPTVVIADEAPGLPHMHTVSVDQAVGAELATSHLIGQGHQTIAHLSGPLDWFDARSRRQGWERALESVGLPRGPLLHGDWNPESGYRAGLKMVAEGLPDAVFAANDGMALGLLRAFRESRVSVPARISVVGFDDIVGSAYYSPPLTTVRQDFEALGVLAVETLRELLSSAGTVSAVRKILPTLVVRDSSRPRRKVRAKASPALAV